jgi:hypothetical protein
MATGWFLPGGAFHQRPTLGGSLPQSLASLTKFLTIFSKIFLHLWKFPVISQMRTNSSGISGI